MRSTYIFGLILIASGIAAAQQPETSFPVGPQYLITQPYPTILQPIATPSYEPSQATGVVYPQTGEAGPVPITFPAYLPWVYWGYQPPEPVEAVPASVTEPRNLPQDYIETGVTAVATSEWPQDHGISLAQVARYWRGHKPHATHVYTNQDIERLQGQ